MLPARAGVMTSPEPAQDESVWPVSCPLETIVNSPRWGPPALRLIAHGRVGGRTGPPRLAVLAPWHPLFPPPNRQPSADIRDRPVDATSGHERIKRA